MPIPDHFSAYLVTRAEDGTFQGSIRHDLPLDDLPPGELLVRVKYSSINYKDALSATGHAGVTRRFPHIPGIDAAGAVVTSAVPQFQPGDAVIVAGRGLGMDHWGGFGQYIRVPAEWAVPLPKGLTLLDSMRLGTAGFTAALAVEAVLNQERTRGTGPVLVTGATGGVAMVAIALLAKLGVSVAAVTRKQGAALDQLRQMGAQTVLAPEQLESGNRPLGKEAWAGVVDTVGGPGLEGLLKTTRAGGTVATCGMAAGNQFSSSVFPFILRGVALVGIDSSSQPADHRQQTWERLGSEWRLDLAAICAETGLEGIAERVQTLLAGTHVGRTVVKLN